ARCSEEAWCWLAAVRGGRAHGLRRVGEFGADAGLLDRPELGMLDRGDHATRLDMRVLEDLVQRVDRTDADVALTQLFEPLFAGSLLESPKKVVEDLRMLLAGHLLGNEVCTTERGA